MIQLEELRTSLLNNKDELTELRGALDLENGAQEAAELERLLVQMKRDYGYSELDTFLVLKDILAQVWKARKVS